MLPPTRNSASRLMPCFHFLIMQLQSTINSRGLRTVDSLIYNENPRNNPVKFIDLDNKQILIPEDDDSDIIIVNEDASDENDSKSIDIDAGSRKIANFKQRTDEDISTSENIAFEELHPESSNASYVMVTAPEDARSYMWKLTDWSPCSVCGRTGHQVRGAACQHKNSSTTITVEVEECLVRGISAPRVVRECTVDCAKWQTGNWSKPRCLKSGGNVIVRRKIFCVGTNGDKLPLSACDSETLPAKTRREATVCKAVWEVGPWSRCIGECNGPGHRHRSLRCVWDNGVSRKQSAGPHCENLARPRVATACKPDCTPGGVCRDFSRFCNNVRSMNLCALKRYKLKCCKTCFE